MSNASKFANLHVHSHGSILDGYSTVKELVDEAVRLGQTHLAITDHGNLFMSQQLYAACKEAGITPVIGIEAYIAPSHVDRHHHESAYFAGGGPNDVSSRGAYTHSLIFPKNNQGLKDLYEAVYLSYAEGNWRKNRIDMELIRKYGENWIMTTGCPSGELQTKLRLGMIEEAEEYVRTMQSIIGKDDYYMELMDHQMNIDLESSVLPELMRIAKKFDMPLLATADSHYTSADQSDVHEHMLCISTHSTMDVPTSSEVQSLLKRRATAILAAAAGDPDKMEEVRANFPELMAKAEEMGSEPPRRGAEEWGDEAERLIQLHGITTNMKSRFAFDGSGYHLSSYDQMIELFPEDQYPNAVTNTIQLADKCHVSIDADPELRPRIDLPEGHTEASYLTEQAWEGFHRRLSPENAASLEYVDRLEEELSTIIDMNYPGYFLVVSDFMRWAKRQGIRTGPGRGSAAGALLAYVLDITDAEPIRHGLLFSRFISRERPSPPDVDLDFDDTKRDLVIDYVKNKYGHDHVSQVVTYGMIKAKNAVKDVMRIYGEPYSTGDQLSKAMPEAIFGKTMPLADMYDPSSQRYAEAEEFRRLVKELGVQDKVDVARQLEGRVRSTGVHACAVIISNKSLTSATPMMVRKADGALITQWEYPVLEDLGFLKMDFLGLRNLNIIDNAVRLIKERHGVDLDMQELVEGPMDDAATYRLLQSGRTLGVFQLDSGPIQDLLKLMRADRFEDISAVLALYRPGPMALGSHTNYALRKSGRQVVEAIHPELSEVLDPILGETFGLLTYQEQIMKIAQVVAGYTLGEADLLRRAMGKKKKSEMDVQWAKFHDGGRANGFSEEALVRLWDGILPFADYAFNKSHSVAYGLISYMTAFLKANFTVEYMSALLSSVADDVAKTAEYLEDCRRLGVRVLPPDVGSSLVDYVPVSGVGESPVIRFGFKAVRGLGEASGEVLVGAREAAGGGFAGVDDFFQSVPREVVNKRVLEGLALGGGFDGFGFSRRAWVHQLPELLKQYQKLARARARDSVSLFDLEDVVEYSLVQMDEFPRLEKLKLERNALGLYVSAHPVDGLNLSSQASSEVAGLFDGRVKPVEGWPARGALPVRIAGVLTSLMVKRNKKGESFAIMRLEDRSGSIECVMFSKAYARFGEFLRVDEIYQLSGFSRVRDESINFTVDGVKPLDFSGSGNLSVRVKVTEGQWLAGEGLLRERLARYPVPAGEPGDDVVVSIRSKEGEVSEVRLDVRVSRTAGLLQEVQELFGSRAIGRWVVQKRRSVE